MAAAVTRCSGNNAIAATDTATNTTRAVRADGTWADEDGASPKSHICEFDEKRAPVVVRGNTIVGNNASLSYGIRGACLARDNVISGVETPQACTDGGGNQITP